MGVPPPGDGLTIVYCKSPTTGVWTLRIGGGKTGNVTINRLLLLSNLAEPFSSSTG